MMQSVVFANPAWLVYSQAPANNRNCMVFSTMDNNASNVQRPLKRETMMKSSLRVSSLCLLLGLSVHAYAQDGAILYERYCATCHQSSADEGVPDRDVLAKMSPEQILQVLERGSMRG